MYNSSRLFILISLSEQKKTLMLKDSAVLALCIVVLTRFLII